MQYCSKIMIHPASFPTPRCAIFARGDSTRKGLSAPHPSWSTKKNAWGLKIFIDFFTDVGLYWYISLIITRFAYCFFV